MKRIKSTKCVKGIMYGYKLYLKKNLHFMYKRVTKQNYIIIKEQHQHFYKGNANQGAFNIIL